MRVLRLWAEARARLGIRQAFPGTEPSIFTSAMISIVQTTLSEPHQCFDSRTRKKVHLYSPNLLDAQHQTMHIHERLIAQKNEGDRKQRAQLNLEWVRNAPDAIMEQFQRRIAEFSGV